ncbi:hypothetical protein V8F33_007377, partial [Rhypophila sp. PSN 637]
MRDDGITQRNTSRSHTAYGISHQLFLCAFISLLGAIRPLFCVSASSCRRGSAAQIQFNTMYGYSVIIHNLRLSALLPTLENSVIRCVFGATRWRTVLSQQQFVMPSLSTLLVLALHWIFLGILSDNM